MYRVRGLCVGNESFEGGLSLAFDHATFHQACFSIKVLYFVRGRDRIWCRGHLFWETKLALNRLSPPRPHESLQALQNGSNISLAVNLIFCRFALGWGTFIYDVRRNVVKLNIPLYALRKHFLSYPLETSYMNGLLDLCFSYFSTSLLESQIFANNTCKREC